MGADLLDFINQKLSEPLMKILFFSICIASLLIWQVNTFPSGSGNQVAAQQQASPNQAQVLPSQAERRAQMIRNFEPARHLLESESVPFDPEVLLNPDWQKRLAPAFAQMPEMQITRWGGKQLKGVQLADILYLPDKS